MKLLGLRTRLVTGLFLGATLLLAGCTPAPGSGAAPASSESPLAAPAVSDSPLAAPTPAGAADATPVTSANGTETPAAAGAEQAAPVAAAVTGIPEDVLNSVLADAAQRLGVPVDTLVVTRAEAVTWNDGALGCPEAGMVYTQALVDGYWIVVEAGGEAVDYRAQGNGMFRICDNPAAGSSVKP
jgi:hypothetical protein